MIRITYSKQFKMVNVLLIVLPIVFSLILIAVNIYILALYIHTDDKGFGTVVYTKILVVMGLTLCQAQALMVPLDVANESALFSSSIDMGTFWFALYIIVLGMVSLLLPFALFFYQTDEDNSCVKRTCEATIYTVLANIISVMLLFITWAFFKFVDLPVNLISVAATATYDPTKPIVFAQTSVAATITIESSLAVYIIAILTFFGWILVVIFGGIGVFALPLDLITAFIKRPKARKSGEMKSKKDEIINSINKLLEEGNTLKNQDDIHKKNSDAGWIEKWKNGRTINTKLSEFKAKFQQISEEYQIFKMQLEYAETNPIIPVMKLLLGIIFLLTSILWLLQILIGNVIKGALNRPLVPFFNQLLISLSNSAASFIGTFLFAYLCLYMIWAVQKGNVKFGIRIPFCCRFHPMKENETWMNSFLFNVIVLLIASVGVIQLCISSFPTYTRNTDIYLIVGVQINYMRFYNAFYKNNVFHIAFLVFALLGLIYQLCVCNKKPEYLKIIEKKRRDEE